MKNLFFTIVLLCSLNVLSQEIINPMNKLYFGAEIGVNRINSYTLGESAKSFQGGVVAEFYFARHWSFIGKIKYFETGVSFYQPATSGGLFFSGNSESFGTFDGAVFSVPLDIKWEFRVYRNLAASIKIGYAYNLETKSEYGLYSPGSNRGYSKDYGSLNLGWGMNYFLNKNWAVYIDFETVVGPSRGYSPGFLWDGYNEMDNSLTNFGVKYTFDKKNKEQ